METSSQTPEAAILAELHAANLTEIQEGRLAQERASSPKVKKYGKMLVKDHESADKLVRKEAERLQIELSDALPWAQQTELDDLKASADFDAAFMRDNAASHAKVISDADAARKAVTDPGVDHLLAQLLPKLRDHEHEAEKLRTAAT